MLNKMCYNCSKQENRLYVKNLIDQGMDPNYVTHNGKTPLMMAARFGHVESVVELINHGANVFMVSDCGMTALDIAKVHSKNIEVIEILEKRMKTRKRVRPIYIK